MVTDDRLQKAYAVNGADDVKVLYSDWAGDYEKDVVGSLGYVAPRLAAQALAKALEDRTARVLDCGCGTGLVGQELKALGFGTVDGLDLSSAMLAEAKGKGLYGRLMEGDLTKTLDLDDNSYDGVVCVGTFTHGHVGPAGLRELIRVTRSGGPITFTVHDGVYDAEGYEDAFAALAREGLATVADNSAADYLPGDNIRCRMITLRVS